MKSHPEIHVVRVYEAGAAPAGAARFLVDRLWPRGVKKEALNLKGWLKDLAPSTELRKWYGHDPEKWEEFKTRYFAELEAHPEDLAPLKEALEAGPVVLFYSSRERELNNAVALKEYLERK